MPLFEYQCQSCEHKFEILQSMTEDRLKKCPQCKKNKLQQCFSVPSTYIGPKTVGSFAEQRSKGLSNDAKEHYAEKYKTKKIKKSKRSFDIDPNYRSKPRY